MEEVNYLKWFEKQFYPAVRHLLETGPVMLFFDGHFSHMSITLIKRARDLGIHLFCLPPNTTHVLQPLDVGVFGPMEQCWRTILKNYKISTRAANITKEHFPELIKELWKKLLTPEHLKSGFLTVGLAPFDPSTVKSRQLAPSVHASAISEPVTQTVEGTFTASLTLHTSETPIRRELRVYFCEVLKPAAGCQKTQRRRRVELSCTGEVLTSDEVLERIEKADADREARKRGKGKKGKGVQTSASSMPTSSSKHGASRCTTESTNVTCESCGAAYTVDEADSWIGCDYCESWWHYWCAGLPHMLSTEDDWICDNCS